MSDAASIRDASFQGEVLDSPVPVLVDFWAPWCGPCRMLGPVIDELAAELGGRLKVLKMNVDEEQDTAGSFQVMSIPTLILFRDGQPVERITGALSKDRLLAQISPHL